MPRSETSPSGPLQRLDQRGDVLLEGHRVAGGVEALDHVALPVHQELGEVPLDVVGLLAGGADLGDHGHGGLVLHALHLLVGLGGLQEGVQRLLGLAVHVDLRQLVELGLILGGAELVDLALVAGGLVAELVAGEVQHLEPLVVILLIQLFQRLVLGGEAAAGGRVDDQQHLALQVGQVQGSALAGLDGIIINAHGVNLL